jgi:hypothetical protein
MYRRVLVNGALCAAWLVAASPGAAQTREAVIADEQQKKAAVAKPDQPTKAEKFFTQLEEGKWFVGVPRGWYPIVGSIYPGGGLAPGAGYRHHIGYDSYIDASAMYSIAGYKRFAIAASTPDHANGRLDFSGLVSWIDATQIPFYGLGPDSDHDDRTSFRINRTRAEGAAALRLVDWLQLKLDGGWDKYKQKAGRGRFPSIETVFSPDSAPLLGEDPLYLRGEVSATISWVQSQAYSRRGGLYRLAYEEFNPLNGEGNGDTFGFVRAEVVQHLPILRETWVISLRGRTESIVRESDEVPYFLMPYLGSGSTLRGFGTGRFRDRHTLLLTGELRWIPNRAALDMALFFDAGDVARRRGELTLDDLKTDYGIGVRFHTPTATVLRVELARSVEGWRAVFAAGAPF